jgi:hypothetical protein
MQTGSLLPSWFPSGKQLIVFLRKPFGTNHFVIRVAARCYG